MRDPTPPTRRRAGHADKPHGVPGLPVTLAAGAPLVVARDAYHAMVAAAYAGYPLEACALLIGVPGGQRIDAIVVAENTDASARTYAIGPKAFLEADTKYGSRGLEVVGVMHSHTHTDPYPSPTDIDKADNPLLAGWKYVIVSLRDSAPMLRSYLLDGRRVVEEEVELDNG